MKFVGIDLSLAHFGTCLIDMEGKVLDYHYMTDVKKDAEVDSKHSVHHRIPSATCDSSEHFDRMVYIASLIRQRFDIYNCANKMMMVAIEGYGYASDSSRQYEIAELTGHLKTEIVSEGAAIRVHDPDSVKLFAVGNGHATKEMIYNQFEKETGLKVYTKHVKNRKKVELAGPGTDVADAYFLASLLRTEMLLRLGKIQLKDLPEHQIRVFNRVTKTYPVNLLDRPFIEKTW